MLHFHRPNGEPSLADLLRGLGDIPPSRVRAQPAPGAASILDVEHLLYQGKEFVELLDGVLIDKPLSFPHSIVTSHVAFAVGWWADKAGGVGFVLGPDGPVRLSPQVVFMPAVSFTRRAKLTNEVPDTTYLPVVPDLVVEVPREGNTVLEMERKLKEYFLAGVDLVWFVSLETRTVRVFTSPDDWTQLAAADTLTGGAVLPGFAVPVADLFSTLPPDPPAT